MNRITLFLLLILLLAACGGETNTESIAPLSTDAPASESTTHEATAEHGHDHDDETHADTEGLDTSLFFDGALAEDAAVPAGGQKLLEREREKVSQN